MADPFESPTFGNSLSLRVDGAIGAMSLSPNGRDAVLAGRKGLFVIDLDDPFSTPRWLHHITSWEVADVQWSPHCHVKPSWCVSTSNQKALLWDLSRPSNNAIQNKLHRHTRAITDIHFHPLDPELLATCSIDTFVFTWDMRTPRRPVNKYAEWRAGATQVKWNSSNPFQIASSHHHSFYLWDARKGAMPLARIENAHGGKINGLDFSSASNRLITCSNDKTIKLWDLGSVAEEKLTPTIVINTDYPVARARALPFGADNCCGIMPVRGGDDAIHIVNYKAEFDRARSLGETVYMDAIPDYSFRGHNGPMKDFLWRQQHASYRGFESKRLWTEYQLVTWSPLDFDLKLWPHDKELYDVANYNPLHKKLLELLVGPAEFGDSGVSSPSLSHACTPDLEMSEDAALKSKLVAYVSYVSEPQVSLEDISKDMAGDLLSNLASFTIKTSHETQGKASQLNHLSWISGVRMGRQVRKKAQDEEDDEDGPSNLGEEVSIVGHKFPKLRFEKISVSTGHLVISLRGPMPVLPESNPQNNDSGEGNSAAGGLLASAQTHSANSAPGRSNTVASPSAKPSDSGLGPPPTDIALEPKLIFIRLEIKFPKSYPYVEKVEHKSRGRRGAALQVPQQVKFDIEETHELNEPVKKIMLQNLNEIARFYCLKYNRYCLEPCLRYLMGDKINLDDSTMIQNNNASAAKDLEPQVDAILVGNENWVDDLIDQHEAAAEFSAPMIVSADEEEDDEADLMPDINDVSGAAVKSKRAESGTSGDDGENSLPRDVLHDSTPLPKGCGAVWTRGGGLVCFFIPKESEETKSLSRLGNLKVGGDVFGLSFLGRQASGHRRRHSRAVDDSSEEESSEEAKEGDDTFSVKSHSTTSSSDSFSNDWDEMLQADIPLRSRLPGMFDGGAGIGLRFRSDNPKSSINRTVSGKDSNFKSSQLDDLALRSTKKGQRKSQFGKSVVKVHDFSHLVPEKFELACEYRVLGDSPEFIARHNAEVAFRHGCTEIGEVWKIVEMILVKEVKLRDLSKMGEDFFNAEKLEIGQFYWGNHPFGHAWLIEELFRYFEQRKNLQMLAMLSCILYENAANIKAREDKFLDIPIHTPYASLPPRPSLSAMRENGLLSTDDFLDRVDNSPSQGSLEDYRRLSRKASTLSARDIHLSRPMSPDINPRSESPSRLSSFRRFQSGIGLLGSPPPLFDSYSQEHLGERIPKSFEPVKRSSRFSTSGRKGVAKGIQQKSKAMTSWQHRGKPKPTPVYTIQMMNVDSLNLYDDTYLTPLLSGIDKEKIRAYREQYAELLYSWGLPLHRIKFLKFNYPDTHTEQHGFVDVHECHFGVRKRRAIDPSLQMIKPITPIATARNNDWNLRKKNALQYCGFCNLIIPNRVVVCVKCEHVVHPHCATEWWSIDSSEGEQECPTGCGCSCLEHQSFI